MSHALCGWQKVNDWSRIWAALFKRAFFIMGSYIYGVEKADLLNIGLGGVWAWQDSGVHRMGGASQCIFYGGGAIENRLCS